MNGHATMLGSEVRKQLGIPWPLIPASADKVPMQRWRELQQVAESTVYDHLDAPMWAIPTGAATGVIVLDFDGPAGARKLTAVGLSGHEHITTGSGGAHVYVTHPGWPVLTYAGDGLDVRGDRGMAYVAGRSRKGEYRLLRSLSAPVSYGKLSRAAKKVVRPRKAFAPSPVVPQRPAVFLETLSGCAADDLRRVTRNRNDRLNKLCWRLRCSGVPYEIARKHLKPAALDVGLRLNEVEATIRSAYRTTLEG